MDNEIIKKINKKVFTPRFLDKLHSSIGIRSNTNIEVLVKFDNDESLNKFLKEQNSISVSAGGSDAKRFKVLSVAKSIRVVTLEIRLDVLGGLSNKAEELGVINIDENFRVKMLLDETRSIEKIEFAWNLGFHGLGIKVAVIDTGIDDTHPDLQGVVSKRKNFTNEKDEDLVGHGTHVASIIAGRGIADSAKKGLANSCTLFDGKVLASDGYGSASNVIAGIEWAVENGANIINMSLGASGPFDGTDALSEASNWAVAQGVIVCAAAGNCGPEGNHLECLSLGNKTINTPGCAISVITVGAIDKTKKIAGYSSRGPTWGNIPKPDVVTIGSAMIAARAKDTSMGTPINDFYTMASGTSMATPVCSALIALLIEAAKANSQEFKPEDVKTVLKNNAISIEGAGKMEQGSGFIEMEQILSSVGVYHLEKFKIESFTPEKDKNHIAGESHTWFLVLRNTSEIALFDVIATFTPNKVAIVPPSKSFGTMEGKATERIGYTIIAEEAGEFSQKLVIEYRTAPDGELLQEEKNVIVHIRQKEIAISKDSVNSVLNDTVQKLLNKQNNNGTWTGGIRYNAWTGGMYAILYKVIGLEGEPTKVLEWLEEHRYGLDSQGKMDETWGIIDDPSLHFLESTISAEIALEIWGRSRNQKTWDFIDQQAVSRLASALSLVDPFTQTFAFLASQYAPSGAPPYYSIQDVVAPPLEMLLLPRFVSASVPRLFATWAQIPIIALMVITTINNSKKLPLAKQILLKKAESMLLRYQNEDGSWYATVLPTMAATMAMHFLGYSNDHKVMQKAFGFLKNLEQPDGYIERFHLPVWDTALAVIALRTAGVDPHIPQLEKAGEYLIDSQIIVNGGIAFTKENIPFPDTDDTSFAILALNQIEMLGEKEKRKKDAIKRGLRWLLYMQSDDGGWAAFQKNQTKLIKGRIPYFKDDPPTADVTAHVLSSLKLASTFGYGEESDEAIERGIQWLQTQQMDRGEWFGRWGLTYTYGTVAVLQGLFDVGESMDKNYVQRGVDFLLKTQNEDGGWGEGFATYYNFAAKEVATSTISQTAWSLLGLLVAPQIPIVQSAIDRGIKFLLDRYKQENGWEDINYTVGALWVYKNTLYPWVWGIWALALYKIIRGL